MIYIENPKSITKLLELISGFSKVSGYNISIQKLTVFLYPSNENEIKKTFHLQKHLKK